MEESSDIFSLENIRNSWLKFFEDLFRHVLQETEGIESTVGYDLTPVIKKFENFACKSGLVPSSSEFKSDDDYELSLALAASLELYSAPKTATISGTVLEYATESTCAPGCTSKSAAVPGFTYAPGSESASAEASTSTTEYASTSEYAGSVFASGSVSKPGFTSGHASEKGLDFSDIFSTYDKNLGSSIHRVLSEVAGTDIDSFYHSVKEKIQIKDDLKLFLRRLTDKFLNGSPQQEMYFLAIISRMFSLLYKTGEADPKIFVEAITDTVFEGEMELQLVSSINTHGLILQILRDAKLWIREFQDLKIGNASEYFSS